MGGCQALRWLASPLLPMLPALPRHAQLAWLCPGRHRASPAVLSLEQWLQACETLGDLPGPAGSLVPAQSLWCLYALLAYVFLADLRAAKITVARWRQVFPPSYQHTFILRWKKQMIPKSMLVQLLFGLISCPVFTYQPHEFCCCEEFSALQLLLQVPAHNKFWLCASGVFVTSAYSLVFFPAVTPWFHLCWRCSRKGVPMMFLLGHIFLSDFIFICT